MEFIAISVYYQYHDICILISIYNYHLTIYCYRDIFIYGGDTMNDSKVSAAQARATAKWEKNNYDRSLIRFPKGTQDRIKATGESINGFVNRLVKAALDGPQPVQEAQPQPPATTATAAEDLLQVPGKAAPGASSLST